MIVVNVSRPERSYTISKKVIEKVVRFVLQKEKYSAGEVALVFVNDAIISAIHKKYLHHHTTTDVITFSLGEQGELQSEIYVNIVQARRQAAAFGVSIKNEIIRLIVHGLLHAVGYDDVEVKKKEIMLRMQEQYVTSLSSIV